MIRLADTDDAAAIREIYRPSIENSAISFETEVPSIDEMRRRIDDCLPLYPWIVEEQGGRIRGYAYASHFHVRAAYRWSAQVSVYVERQDFRQGVARQLYAVLVKLLESQGIRQVLAGITVPNPPSQAFHEALGFKLVGIAQDVGYKLDAWQGMGWWQRSIGAGSTGAPAEFIPFGEVAQQWEGDLSRLTETR